MKVLVLQEGSRPNEIGYHFTNLEGLVAILNSNIMKATNKPVFFDKKEVKWKETSDEYADYSKSWSYTRKKTGMYFRGNNLKDSVRLTLDIDKLSERQRIFPFSWRWGKNEEEFEFEERVEGDTNNIKSYIKEIAFSPALNFDEKSYYEISKKSSKLLAEIFSIINRFEYLQKDLLHYEEVKNDYNSSLFSKLDDLVTKGDVLKEEVFSEFINLYSKYDSLSKFGKEISNYYFARRFMESKGDMEELYNDFKNFSDFKVFSFEDIFSKKSTKSKQKIFDKFVSDLNFDFDEFISKNNIKISYLGSTADTAHFSGDSKDIKVFSKKEAISFLNTTNKNFLKVQDKIESMNDFYKSSRKSFSKKGGTALWDSFVDFRDYLLKESIDNIFRKMKIKDTTNLFCFDNGKNLIVGTDLEDVTYINKHVKTNFKETEYCYSFDGILYGVRTPATRVLSLFWKKSTKHTGATLKKCMAEEGNVFNWDLERTGFFIINSGKIYEIKSKQNREDFKLVSYSFFSHGKRNIEMSELIASQIPIDKFARIAEKRIDK